MSNTALNGFRDSFDFWATLPKTKYRPIADLLRIPQVDHNYRYPKISQIFKPVYFCRYVGEITGVTAELNCIQMRAFTTVNCRWIKII